MLRRKTFLVYRDSSQLKRVLIATFLAFAFAASQAHADTITGYVNNPTGDSTDFTAGVTALGGSVTTLDVGTLSTGALNTTAFLVSNGVTLTGTGSFATVSAGAGPGQGNTFSPPLSAGEGPHAAANWIGENITFGGSGSLTVSFNKPVLGAGLYLIDLFNPPACGGGGPCDDVTIQAFTGANGTGTSLGIFHAVEDNFQPNHLYFMGITSSGGDIGSIVLTQPANPSADLIGLGNILYGAGGPSPVPEPSTVGLMLLGIGLVFLMRNRVGQGLRQVR